MVNHEDYEPIHFDNVKQYALGGFPAISIGDEFQAKRYRILNHLGRGACSNVWLAWDSWNNCKVSIKAIRARSSSNNIELEIMKRLDAGGDAEHEGRKHLPRLLDHFYKEGPNGNSLFLVLERLGPSLYAMLSECLPDSRFDISRCRRISRQLLLAVDYLHSCGIVHADIHEGNVLFCIPPTLELRADSFKPVAYDVIKYDGGPLEEGVPRHYVESMTYEGQNCEELVDVQLVDFSNSFFIVDPPATAKTIPPYMAPEMLFKKPLSKKLDTWGLACTTYRLITGQELFFIGISDRRELVSQYYNLIGETSANWLSVNLANAVQDGVWKDWPATLPKRCEKAWDIETSVINEYSREDDSPSEEEVFKEKLKIPGRYIKKMMIVDANERPDTKELLEDEWVQEQQDD